jgi:hypothetical protein
VFANGATLSGMIEGGGKGTLDYSASATAVSLSITALAADSSATGTGTGVGAGFSGVDNLQGGPAANSLLVPAALGFHVTGTNAGTVGTSVTYAAFQAHSPSTTPPPPGTTSGNTTPSSSTSSSTESGTTTSSPTPPATPPLPAPTKTGIHYVVKHGQTFRSTIRQALLSDFTAPRGEHLSIRLAGKKPAVGKLTLKPNGSFTFTPPPGFHGKVSFKVTAFNGTGASKPLTVTLQVK